MHFFRRERLAVQEEFYQVLAIAEELGDQDLAALAQSNIARTWIWRGEFNRALPLMRQILATLEQRQNWTEWVLTDSLLGIALAARGDYHAGVAEAEQFLQRAKGLHHLTGILAAYSMLALIHLMGGATRPMLSASRA